jgi:taurine dioxygenase
VTTSVTSRPELRPLAGALGVEVLGADLRCDAHAEIARDAFAKHAVVVVRGQRLGPEEQVAFARRFGAINVNRFFKSMDGHPEVALVIKEADQKSAIGERWHTDHSYDVVPAMGSVLYAVDTPPVGGDTVFASMAAAYDALSPPFRAALAGLRAWHSSRHVFGAARASTETGRDGRIGNSQAARQDALHPLLIVHPLSGRRCLYVNPTFTVRIDGFHEDESRALLDFLYAHAVRPEFCCRVRWEPGDLTIWDNRATWHKAINDYDGHRREMRRVTVEGVPLVGEAPDREPRSAPGHHAAAV